MIYPNFEEKRNMPIYKDLAISENGLIFNPHNGESFQTNQSGIEILKMLQKNLENTDIIEFLVQKYDEEQKTIEKDYYDFINCLNRYMLIDENITNKKQTNTSFYKY